VNEQEFHIGTNQSTIIGGDGAKLAAGHHSTLIGGDNSILTAGDDSALIGGHDSVLTGGHGSTFNGGERSDLVTWWSEDGIQFRIATACVGENGIVAGTTYRLDGDGKFAAFPVGHEE